VPDLSRLLLLPLALAALPPDHSARRADVSAVRGEDAAYIVTGVVRPAPPGSQAHFRLTITAVGRGERLRPGQDIDVRFVADRATPPPVGEEVRVWLLGGVDGLYFVCPGTECEPVGPPDGPGAPRGFVFRPEGVPVVVGAALAVLLIGAVLWRVAHSRRPRGR
jgi:hypothetical protein